jgi:hypothetical protein
MYIYLVIICVMVSFQGPYQQNTDAKAKGYAKGHGQSQLPKPVL